MGLAIERALDTLDCSYSRRTALMKSGLLEFVNLAKTPAPEFFERDP